MIWSSW